MHRKTRFIQAGWLAVVWLAGSAPVPARAQSLPLVPQPRQVKLLAGRFVLTRKTRIVLTHAAAARDRVAAEMLAGDIERLSGWKLKIATARSLPRSRGIIFLGRAGQDRRLDRALAADGLAIGAGFSGQGYVLDAGPRRIIVAGRTGQGVFYGIQTLRQLLEPGAGGGLTCPAAAVTDWPAMAWRGVQDDLSRGPIPTLTYLKRQIRTLSAYKINLLALYMENVFDYPSEPLAAPREAALTAAEARELVDYAGRYYVTVMPEQESFGHLHKLLREEAYSSLAELPHGSVLSPANEQSFELISRMLTELAPLFPGPFFHVGADETLELGQGQARALAAKAGLGLVYLDFLKRIDAILSPYHKRVLFWGDIALRYPQLLGSLPKNMIAVPWNYGPRANFDSLLAPFRDADIDTFVAPGASNWNRIFPDLDGAFVNIRNFVRDGQKYHSLGMLDTTWNDSGEGLVEMTWPALLFGAACSWQPGKSSVEQFWASYDWAFYRHPGHEISAAILEIVRAGGRLTRDGVGGASDQEFWVDPFSPAGVRLASAAIGDAHALRMEAEDALAALYREQPNARLHASTIDDIIFAAQRLDALGMKIQYTAEIGGYYWDAYQHMADHHRAASDLYRISAVNGRLQDLRDATTRLGNAYSRLWRRQYAPFWLGNVLVRYNNLAALFQTKIQAMDAIIGTYRQSSILPSPEALGFTYRLSSGAPR
ncbi:MAG TPA: beta-N-acetylhexosaminidase [Candidatus Acidoferrales bacterium]|nr:beta-N-acetylhexosaminidase [Candidatus Acidoferrales bacterium]